MVLISSCKGEAASSENPLLATWDTPFGVPPFDRIQVSDYMPAFRVGMDEQMAEIEAIVSNSEEPSFANVIQALDGSGATLDRVSNVFFLLSNADSNDEMQKVEEKISPLLSAHNDAIMMNGELFARIKSVYDRRNELGLDPLQMRLTEKTYKNFERSGANLDAGEKAELMEINKELSLATFRFGSNLLGENARFQMFLTDKELSGLPSNVRAQASSAAEEAGRKKEYLFTLSGPSIWPFLTYSDRRELREKMHTAYLNRGNNDDEYDNKQLVNDITRLRNRKAHLLGFDSHATFVLDEAMAQKPENVYSLLGEVWEPALIRATQELEDMREIKRRETGSGDFETWDWWYYAEKVRKSKYSLDQETLRPYFSLGNVQRGIFEVSNRLYGLMFRPIVAPVYNDECFVYEVLNADGTHLSVLYLDFHPRPGKKGGAWCGAYRYRTHTADGVEEPVVTIVCNFTRPSGKTPALLTLDEVETFFHEFGHALHIFFTDVPYKGLRRVERDFVELPSQIMENWAVEPEMLRSYAIHYSTGRVIPENLIEKIQNTATFNQGFITTELLAASFTDMDIHTIKEFNPLDVLEFERYALYEKRGLIPEIAPRYRYPYFAHIFDGGYSAGYYGYIWAEVLDKDAYQAFVETGELFNRRVAKRFRDEILARGGAADGMELYRNFRGKEPSRQPLLRSRGLIE